MTATAGTINGSTGVSVIVHQTHVDPMAPPGSEGNFPDQPPTGALSPAIDVSARRRGDADRPPRRPTSNGKAPATAGDLYRVRIVGGLATVDTILAVTPGFKLDSLPLARRLARCSSTSTHGAPITIYVDHWDATTGAQRGPPRHGQGRATRRSPA